MPSEDEASQWKALQNEAAVELRIVLPLLQSLGYTLHDIAAKVPVVFQEGRKGRPNEADFVVFDGPVHNRDQSLIVVEAKGPRDKAEAAKAQAESYAFATRAPLVLLVSDQDIEVWQVNATYESARAFSCAVADLESRRGELEALISREAAVAWADARRGRSISDAAGDFTTYIEREVQRTGASRLGVARTLERSGGLPKVDSEDLLMAFSSGALVVAPSGYGKTTLSVALFRQALAAMGGVVERPLPLQVDLVELEGMRLIDFARERLGAHKPGLTPLAFERLLREIGLCLICDGLDRLSAVVQSGIVSEVRTLRRDYPRLQIFVSSRATGFGDLDLPVLTLAGLNTDERNAISRDVLGDRSYAFTFGLPSRLATLCENPLLLNRVIEHWREEGRYPHRLTDLFETWLQRLLTSSRATVSQQGRRRALLRRLADTAEGGRLPVEAALAIADSAGGDAAIDDLVETGAVSHDGGAGLRFEHEALADYLRARTFLEGADDVVESRLRTFVPRDGSFFPILLVALATRRSWQSILWRRFAEHSLDLCIDAIRYRATPEESPDGQAFLDDILEGLSLPLDGLFPAFRARIEADLTGFAGHGLVISGTASEHHAHYVFSPSDIDGEGRGLESGINLTLSGLGLDSGRLVGLQLLRTELIDAIERRDLTGGAQWRRELARSGLRTIRHELGTALEESAPFADWRGLLQPFSGRRLRTGRVIVEVDDVVAMLDELEAEGLDAFPEDALPAGWTTAPFDEERVRAGLRQHHDLVQALYREIVDADFARVANRLGWRVCLPVQTTIRLDFSGPAQPWFGTEWRPTAGLEPTEVVDEPARRPTNLQQHWDSVLADFDRLGRDATHARLTISHSVLSHLEPKATERSSISGALKALKEDLTVLFRDLPSHGPV